MPTVVSGWWDTLRQHPEIALFVTVGGGALLGRLRFRTVVLGAVTGTLLVGVLVGQAGVTLDSTIKEAAFAASLFALGYNGGPSSSRAFGPTAFVRCR